VTNEALEESFDALVTTDRATAMLDVDPVASQKFFRRVDKD